MAKKECHRYLDYDIIGEEKPLLLDLFNDIVHYSDKKINSNDVVDNFVYKFNSIIKKYYDKENVHGSYSFNDEENRLFSQLFKLIAYTRDIKNGLGKRDLTYAMICCWNAYYPECITEDFLYSLFTEYGSWEDVKLLCNYYIDCNNSKEDELINKILNVMAEELTENFVQYNNKQRFSPIIGFAAKWAPREKSKQFGWIFNELSVRFHKKIFNNVGVQSKNFYKKKHNKINKFFRKVLTTLNKYIDTVQIKQCSNEWDKIDFNKVSLSTKRLQHNAFLNITKNGSMRCIYNSMRSTAARNFRQYITHKEIFKDYVKETATDEELINMITTYNYVTGKMEMRNYNLYEEINDKWQENGKNVNKNVFETIIPVIDENSIINKENRVNAYSPNIKLLATYLRMQESNLFNELAIVGDYAYDFKQKKLSNKLTVLLNIMQKQVSTNVQSYKLSGRSNYFNMYNQYYKNKLEKYLDKYPDRTDGGFYSGFTIAYLFNTDGKFESNAYKQLPFGIMNISLVETTPIILFEFNGMINLLIEQNMHALRKTFVFNAMSNLYLNNYYNNFKKYFYKNFIKNDKEYTKYDNFCDTLNNTRYDCIDPFN